MDTLQLVAAAFAIAPVLFASLTARPWLTARIRAIEYLQQRLALISALLGSHRKVLEPKQIAALENEIKSITIELLASSRRSEQDRILEWDRQIWWKRFLTLPKPESTLDWFTCVVSYLYLALAVIYFMAFWPMFFLSPEPVIENVTMMLFSVLSLGTCVLTRRWNLQTAKKRIIASRDQHNETR